jgi:dihydroxyacetone kinase
VVRPGGTSGALWGLLLDQVARLLGDQDRPGVAELAHAIASGAALLQSTGGAQPGDKTLLDTLVPFAAELRHQAANGLDVASAWSAAADVARVAAHDTANLSPRVGRARPLAERSVGHRDPGAVSMSLCIDAVTGVLLMRGADESPAPMSNGEASEPE